MADAQVTTDGVLFFLTLISSVFGIFLYFSKQRDSQLRQLAAVRQEMYEKFSLKEDIEKRLGNIETKIDKLFDRLTT